MPTEKCPEPGCDYVAIQDAEHPGSLAWKMGVHNKKHRDPDAPPVTLGARLNRLEERFDALLDHLRLEIK